MTTRRISVRITPKLQQRLKLEAGASRKRLSDIVSDALEHYFNQTALQETCYDLAVKTGFLGVAKNAQTDLGTSRKHFKGLGR